MKMVLKVHRLIVQAGGVVQSYTALLALLTAAVAFGVRMTNRWELSWADALLIGLGVSPFLLVALAGATLLLRHVAGPASPAEPETPRAPVAPRPSPRPADARPPTPGEKAALALARRETVAREIEGLRKGIAAYAKEAEFVLQQLARWKPQPPETEYRSRRPLPEIDHVNAAEHLRIENKRITGTDWDPTLTPKYNANPNKPVHGEPAEIDPQAVHPYRQLRERVQQAHSLPALLALIEEQSALEKEIAQLGVKYPAG